MQKSLLDKSHFNFRFFQETDEVLDHQHGLAVEFLVFQIRRKQFWKRVVLNSDSNLDPAYRFKSQQQTKASKAFQILSE